MKISIKTGLLAAAMSLTAPFAAFAEDAPAAPVNPLPGTLTGNIALTNDYIFRGFTQTSHNAAVQGGLDWDTGAGFHFGTWGSSLNFADGNQATTEIDLYGGYAGKIDAFTYDVGFTYYWYPGASKALKYDYVEVYGKAGYDFGVASVNAGIAYTPSNTATSGQDATYINAVLTVPIMDLLAVSGGAGYYIFQGAKDQVDYNIGATIHVYTWFDVDARYYNTDNKAGKALHLTDDRFVVSVKRTF